MCTRQLFFVVVVAGCNLDSSLKTVDAADPDTVEPACDPAKPFDPPVLVAGVNSNANDWAARLAGDGLTLFVSSERDTPGVAQGCFSSTRTNLASTFAEPVILANVNLPGAGAGIQSEFPTVTADGKTMFLASNDGHSAHTDILSARRDSPITDFMTPFGVANINSPVQNDEAPFILPDGNTLYFGSDRSGDFEIYKASLNGTSFSPPDLVIELGTSAFESYPVTNSNHLRMFFASTRADGGARGSFDIWTATRESTTEQFSAPSNVSELNSVEVDLPTWLSEDGCTLLLSSSRVGGLGGLDIYQATRPL